MTLWPVCEICQIINFCTYASLQFCDPDRKELWYLKSKCLLLNSEWNQSTSLIIPVEHQYSDAEPEQPFSHEKVALWGKSEGIIFLSNEADRRGIIGDPATNPLILQHCLEMSTARSSHFRRLQHSLSDNLGSQNGRTLFQLPIRLLNICPPSKLSKSSIGTLWENRRGPDSESHCRSSHNGEWMGKWNIFEVLKNLPYHLPPMRPKLYS